MGIKRVFFSAIFLHKVHFFSMSRCWLLNAPFIPNRQSPKSLQTKGCEPKKVHQMHANETFYPISQQFHNFYCDFLVNNRNIVFIFVL